jgi:hypothetical protein
VIAIRTEDDAWRVLKDLLAKKISEAQASEVEFGDWAQVTFSVAGDKYHSSLTPRLMRGLGRFHRTLEESFALVEHGKPDARKLSEEDVEDLQLEYLVLGGSSLIRVELDKSIEELLKKLPQLNARQALLLALILALGYCGKPAVQGYFEMEKGRQQVEIRKQETERSRHEVERSKQETERMRILDDAHKRAQEELKANIRPLKELPRSGYQDLLRSIPDADSAELLGIHFSAEDLEEFQEKKRPPYKGPRHLNGKFVVHALANTNSEEFFLTVSQGSTRIRASYNPKKIPSSVTERINKALQEKGSLTLHVTITNRYTPVKLFSGRIDTFD